MNYCSEATVKCASQRHQRSVLIPQQRVSARTVVKGQGVIWFQLKHSSQSCLRFLLATKTSIGFCQATHHNDVVETCLELSRSDFYNFERSFVCRFILAEFSINTNQEPPR